MSEQTPETAPEITPDAGATTQDATAAPLVPTPEEVLTAEKVALNIQRQSNKINLQAAPIRQYLEGTVVPTLMQGLQAVSKERPENPVEFLAYYLLSHNPQNSKKTATAPASGGGAAPAEGAAAPSAPS